MDNELILKLLVFAGCAVLGRFLARLILSCVAGAAAMLSLYAVFVHAAGGAGNRVAQAVTLAGRLFTAIYTLVESLVHAPGIIGLVMGVMAGLHFWKLDRERNRGIVRYPRYPSPE
ncbi:MAG TPA: hypothetical protein PLG50_07745 [bacterium]|nr:hypothetical protein [bacterium]HQG45537.1 hypothetical protein [bacterium]HQI48380.1 hypothetical protein [bacterium]HQJ63747.1 hypothetical protein [bacterium]